MKKKIIVHTNHSKAFTGFGKNAKNILKHLYGTGKYEIVEFCNGLHWGDPNLKKLPWKCVGSLPDDPLLLQKLNKDPQLARAAGYGGNMVDRIIREEKPDLYLGIEDIWAFNGYTERPWWNKTNCMIWTTLDSLPILPDAVKQAPKIKNYFVWASFAEKALHDLGHTHVKTLRGSLDTEVFHPTSPESKKEVRKRHGIGQNEFIIGFVFRNQLRKSVPNLLEGFKLFLQQEPRSKARLLLHTHWGEGWDIPRLIDEKGIDPQLILTTYFCSKCRSYELRPFTGQQSQCKTCGSKGTLNTTNVKAGVSDDQLNEIYNVMDVYCHPFTSGGQEIPVQEAKLTELITLVTDYSCGEDSCTPASGGIPLEWSEYREPGTQFIKASTYPSSISKNLKRVFNMNPTKRRDQEKRSRQFVLDNYSTNKIGASLEDLIDNLPAVDWDFNFSAKVCNPDYSPPSIKADSDWIIDLYDKILLTKVDEKDDGHKHWMQRLKTDLNRPQVLNYFQNVAMEENNKNRRVEFGDLFDSPPERKRALFVLNGDANTIFLSTALLESFSKTYPQTDLYFACPPQFHNLLGGNPYVYKTIPFTDFMLDELAMVGSGPREPFVDYYFNLSNSATKNITLTNTHFDLCI